jgi:hypothetical protein
MGIDMGTVMLGLTSDSFLGRAIGSGVPGTPTWPGDWVAVDMAHGHLPEGVEPCLACSPHGFRCTRQAGHHENHVAASGIREAVLERW